MDLSNLDTLVTWLMAGGTVPVVMWFVAWAFEKMDWYQAIGSKGRSAIILMLSAVLGAGVVWLMNEPEIYAAIKPYAQAILTTIVAWLGSQVAHRADSERR